MADWWSKVSDDSLAQGDLLNDCPIPLFQGISPGGEDVYDVDVQPTRTIVVSQSCDLENNKLRFVAMCPTHTLREFASVNEGFGKAEAWERVRQGRSFSLHMIASPYGPDDNQQSLVVDFGHIVSLPVEAVKDHARKLDERFRLESPFLEHFSQAFARFFMRVGLPSQIARFK